jgi:hypothetical protein
MPNVSGAVVDEDTVAEGYEDTVAAGYEDTDAEGCCRTGWRLEAAWRRAWAPCRERCRVLWRCEPLRLAV